MYRKTPKSSESILKVVMLGDGGVGKSCLMNAYVSETYDANSAHTIGVDFLRKSIKTKHSEAPITLQIWDTAGQERYRSLRTPFYRGADACLLNFAVDDEIGFENLKVWKTEFVKYADVKDVSNFPFLVIGNKIDLPERKVSEEKARQWCSNNNMTYFETSAKVMFNVDLAFVSAANQALETHLRDSENRINGVITTINLTTKRPSLYRNKKKDCC